MLDEHDTRRLRHLLAELESFTSGDHTEAIFLENSGSLDLLPLTRGTRFDHAAILVFPDCVDDVSDLLRSAGWQVSDPIASVVVRQRLAHRYGVALDALDVSIVRGSLHREHDVRRDVEIFAVARSLAEATAARMIADERDQDTESHVALRVRRPTADTLNKLREICRRRLCFQPDGGGYNPHDEADSGGRSVLYFRLPPGSARRLRYQRLELACAGHHPEVIATHLRDTSTAPATHLHGTDAAIADPPRQLLSLLAGHWAARTVHVAADLGIPDVLAGGPLSAEDVARQTACNPDATTRLLRYLAHLGLVRTEGPGRYANTAIGELICADNSFRDLVLLYGEEFYQAWTHLLTATRTGSSAFGHTFGLEHFEYFAGDDAAARRFDRAMSAVTGLVAAAIGDAFDFPRNSTVIDVGGGNGTLLRAILGSHTTVSGIVFDREHVASNAVTDEDRQTYAGRLTSVAGDFFIEVTAGCGVYLLSRILHDWDDNDCLRILRACRAAADHQATLLILERLLPDHDSDSLALPWDMQMLAITGGRERGRHEYSELLRAAGFKLDEVKRLPVDMNLMIARPS